MDLGKAVFYYRDTADTVGFMDWDELQTRGLSPDFYTHSLHYGRGVFEGIRAVFGQQREGLYLITLDDHLERLQHSSKYMGLMQPDEIPTKAMKDLIGDLIKRNIQSGFLNPEDGCYVRPLIFTDKKFAPDGQRIPGMGVYSGEHRRVLMIGLFPWGNYLEENARVLVFEDGISSPLRRHKTCAGYGFGGIAKDLAVEKGYDETLITDPSPERHVLEGGGENIFFFQPGRVITPSTNQDILPGTKRQVLIEMLRNRDINVEERPIPLAEVRSMNAAAFTGTAAGVVPIASLTLPEALLDRMKTEGYKMDPDYGFDPTFQLRRGFTLADLAEEYQRLIRGKEVSCEQRELQRRIRTFVPL